MALKKLIKSTKKGLKHPSYTAIVFVQALAVFCGFSGQIAVLAACAVPFFFDSAPLSLIFGPPFARASLNLVMCSHFLTLELINTSFIFANLRGRLRKLCKAEQIYQ